MVVQERPLQYLRKSDRPTKKLLTITGKTEPTLATERQDQLGSAIRTGIPVKPATEVPAGHQLIHLIRVPWVRGLAGATS